VELRQLRYFLAVAAHLHFSHAAASLGIAQATLSEQVRRLEDELGFPLLARSSRHVSLTPAGKTFQQGAARALQQLDHAAHQAVDIAAGRSGRLRLGAGGTALTHAVPTILRALRTEAPDLHVTVVQLSTAAQLTGLVHGDLDAGFVRGGAMPTAGVRLEPLVAEPLQVVVPADHRLATARPARVELEQLVDATLVIWPRADAPGFYDQIIDLCARHGFRPHAILQASDTPSQLALVAAGLGIAIQPTSFTTLGHPGVVTLALADPAPTNTLYLAWRAPIDNPAVIRLRDTARQLAANGSLQSAARR
jgi:DNA-binding transcriptional LysR family regulator